MFICCLNYLYAQTRIQTELYVNFKMTNLIATVLFCIVTNSATNYQIAVRPAFGELIKVSMDINVPWEIRNMQAKQRQIQVKLTNWALCKPVFTNWFDCATYLEIMRARQ